MRAATDLSHHGHASWRDAEAAAFAVMDDLRAGVVPDLDGADGSTLRRIGYLADMTRLFLDPARREAVDRLVAEVDARLGDAPRSPPIPAAPWPGRRSDASTSGAAPDDVGRSWGVAPGISLARYRAESSARDALRVT